MSPRLLRGIVRTCTGTLIGLLFLVPILYVVLISFEEPRQFVTDPLAVPQSLTAANFGSAWTQGDLGVQLLNTVLYSVIAGALTTILSLLIAFPVARRLIRGSTWLYSVMVAGICIPMPIIPLFVEAQKLHLFDNRIGYILLHLEMGLPAGVILLTAFISGLPVEIDEAAALDGCSYPRFVFQFVLRLAWPAVVITFLYSLLNVWNDIIGPMVFLVRPELYPVTRGVYQFAGANQDQWPMLAAAVIIVSLPVLVLFAVSQRQLLRSTVGISM